jgi:hypothetical protein
LSNLGDGIPLEIPERYYIGEGDLKFKSVVQSLKVFSYKRRFIGIDGAPLPDADSYIK